MKTMRSAPRWVRMRRKAAVALAVTASVSSVVACSSSAGSSGSGGSGSGKTTDVTIQLALVPPKMIFLGFYVAQDEGFFAKNHLKVKLVPEPTGAQAVRAVEAGQGYFTAGGTDGVVSADAAGGKLSALWNYGADDLSIIADSKVTSVASLKGTTIGVTDKVGPAYTLPVLAMESAGLKISDASYAVLGGRPALVGALASGRIDAAAFHVDDGLKVVKKDPNVHIVAQMSTLAPDWWYGCVSVSTAYAKSHATVVKELLTAMIQAQRWMYKNASATIAIGTKYTQEDPDIVSKTYQVLTANHLWNTDNSGLDPAHVNYTLAAFKRFGVIPSSANISYASLVDTSYITSVLSTLGSS